MPDSRRNIIITLALVQLNTDGTVKERLTLPSQDYFRSAEVNHPMPGAWFGKVTLYEQDPEGPGEVGLLEILFLAVGYRYEFELSWHLEDEKPEQAPIYRATIVSVAPQFDDSGTEYVLDLASGTTALASTQTPTQLTSFPKGTNVSDVVRQIADYYGWSTTYVTAAGNQFTTIEATNRVLDEPMQVGNDSHFTFILQKILKLAVSSTGRPFLFFVDAKNVVHFHSDTYNAIQQKTYQYRATDGEVISFEPSVDLLFSKLAGGANASFIAPNSATGTFESLSTTEEPLNLNHHGNSKYSVEVSPGENRKGVVVRDRAELRKIAEAAHISSNNAGYTATLTVLGTHLLTNGQIIRIDKFRRNGTLHLTSGQYSIVSFRHAISSTWTTEIDLIRSGFSPDGTAEKLPGVIVQNSRTIEFSDLTKFLGEAVGTIVRQIRGEP